jgi:pimeloyl-ACP methyl ester carboxylesterase
VGRGRRDARRAASRARTRSAGSRRIVGSAGRRARHSERDGGRARDEHRCGPPLHLVGHAYGSFVALAAAAELGPRVASLTLIEPAIFPPRQAWDEDADWIEIEAWSARHLALARAAILAQLPQVGAGWEMTGAAHVDRATFAVAHAPALVLEGAGSTYAVRRVQACLFGLLPRATLLRFADAGDMLPVTHADEVAAAIARHVAGDETPAEADAQRLLQEESSASRCAAPARGVNRASRAR